MKTWKHAANEWADAATNGLQWVKNIRDGISTPEEAITALKSDIVHAQSEQPGIGGVTSSEALAQPQQEPVGKWIGNYIEWTENPYKFKDGQPIYTAPPARKPISDDAKAVIDAARLAMDESVEANDGEGGIKIASHLAAALSLCLDNYDRAIEAAHGIKETP